jgi:hypothetical protein
VRAEDDNQRMDKSMKEKKKKVIHIDKKETKLEHN